MERESAPVIPLDLVFRSDGTWRDYWREQKLFLAVAGTPDAPAPAQVATLRDVLARWPEVQQTITAFVRGLASGEHVPLEPASLGGFAARSCGFDQELVFSSISVTDASSPHHVHVTFYTGYPDGYATYAVVLADGVPTAISAFAS
jgi:hypothetical protein